MKHYVKNAKMVVLKDIPKNIKRLQCSWVRRLSDDSFHEWKIFFLNKNAFGNSFIFHSNLPFKRYYVKSFPHYHRDILLNWKIYFSQKPEVPSCILSQNLWYINIFKLIRNLFVWPNFLIFY